MSNLNDVSHSMLFLIKQTLPLMSAMLMGDISQQSHMAAGGR